MGNVQVFVKGGEKTEQSIRAEKEAELRYRQQVGCQINLNKIIVQSQEEAIRNRENLNKLKMSELNSWLLNHESAPDQLINRNLLGNRSPLDILHGFGQADPDFLAPDGFIDEPTPQIHSQNNQNQNQNFNTSAQLNPNQNYQTPMRGRIDNQPNSNFNQNPPQGFQDPNLSMIAQGNQGRNSQMGMQEENNIFLTPPVSPRNNVVQNTGGFNFPAGPNNDVSMHSNRGPRG
jgi:hypothetical protein